MWKNKCVCRFTISLSIYCQFMSSIGTSLNSPQGKQNSLEFNKCGSVSMGRRLSGFHSALFIDGNGGVFFLSTD